MRKIHRSAVAGLLQTWRCRPCNGLRFLVFRLYIVSLWSLRYSKLIAWSLNYQLTMIPCMSSSMHSNVRCSRTQVISPCEEGYWGIFSPCIEKNSAIVSQGFSMSQVNMVWYRYQFYSIACHYMQEVDTTRHSSVASGAVHTVISL